jgi:hypothetical protein
MNRTQLINHLRAIIRIHEIDGQKPNFLYYELKSLMEELVSIDP